MREMLDPPPRRGPAYKTKLCVLWRRGGSCPRGPSCGFAHGPGELRSPPPGSSFPPRPAPGRPDHREFRGRPERRSPPRRRYSSDRDTRGNLFRDQRPSSRDRGSSHSRSPIRKSERRHKKKVDGEKTGSTGSLNSSDNEDRKKEDRHSSGDEKDDTEAQLKQIALEMKALHEDKSKVQMKLDQKIDEAGILSARVDDLESQLNKEKEDCERMTSKIKKLVKAHGRYMKAQEDLKRSQGRFERLADSLASDSLKSGTKEQGSSVNAGNDDPSNAYEMSLSPYDQRQKRGLTSGKRSTTLPTSEDEKTGKKRRVNGDDMVHMSGKYIQEDALESYKNSNGTDTPKSLSLKKFGEGDSNNERNVISSRNDFTDRYNGNEEEDHVDV